VLPCLSVVPIAARCAGPSRAAQVRAARALLGWTAKDLAQRRMSEFQLFSEWRMLKERRTCTPQTWHPFSPLSKARGSNSRTPTRPASACDVSPPVKPKPPSKRPLVIPPSANDEQPGVGLTCRRSRPPTAIPGRSWLSVFELFLHGFRFVALGQFSGTKTPWRPVGALPQPGDWVYFDLEGLCTKFRERGGGSAKGGGA
jgi:hypothetical protein